jgi:hypothetical protein
MPGDAEKLIFLETPEVEFASNTFHNIPVVLQYDDTPLLEVVQIQLGGFSTQFSIYNRDGVYLAKAVGSQLHLTPDGRKSNLVLRHPPLVTVCELDGRTLFEIRRKEAAGLHTQAELFAPDGRFLKSNSSGVPESLIKADGSALHIGGVIMSGNHFSGGRIGVWIRSNGSIFIGQ